MKCLLIFPPQWKPLGPHLVLPTLQSALLAEGHDVTLLDANSEFYNTVLQKRFLIRAVKMAARKHDKYAERIIAKKDPARELHTYPVPYQKQYMRYRKIGDMRNKYRATFRPIIDAIDEAMAVVRDASDFYKPVRVSRAYSQLERACRFLSIIYYPTCINFFSSRFSPYLQFHYDSLYAHVSDESANLFWQVAKEQWLDQIAAQQYDYIGISISGFSQMVPGLTLAWLCKQHTDAHINLGGTAFTKQAASLSAMPAFFDTFCHSVITGEGERPLSALLDHLAGQRELDEVPNVIYGVELAGQRTVRATEPQPPLKLSRLCTPDYRGMPLDSYYMPHTIFNLQSSRGCYWRKCTFCTHHFGSRFCMKSVKKTVADLRDLHQRHGARYFHFVDEAIHPGYLGKLADGILEAGLDIDWFIYARLDPGFTPDLFAKARRAGLRMILWGFESANQRIYNLMRKGSITHPDDKLAILQQAVDADIWNFLFIMFGFPSETEEEANETVDFLYDNRHLCSFGDANFTLVKDAPILEEPARYTITEVTERSSRGFTLTHQFRTSTGMTSEQMERMLNHKELVLNRKRRYRKGFSRERLFLYICHYGIDSIVAMKRKYHL